MIIKTLQYKALGEIERQKFCQTMISFIRARFNESQLSKINEPLEVFVDDLCKSGLKIGLKSQIEISKFILLNIVIGKDFIEKESYLGMKKDLISGKYNCERILNQEFNRQNGK
jgi:hypothetical protein